MSCLYSEYRICLTNKLVPIIPITRTRQRTIVMPLRAIIDGESCIATLFSDADWNALKLSSKSNKTLVIMPCCNHPGHLAVSKLGTKFFAHNPRVVYTKNCERRESLEHLQAKAEVVRGCRPQVTKSPRRQRVPIGVPMSSHQRTAIDLYSKFNGADKPYRKQSVDMLSMRPRGGSVGNCV